MANNKIKSKMQDLDIVAKGVFTMPMCEPHYNVRAISEYCREKGIDPSELSDKELEMIKGYIECAEENKKEAELILPAGHEALIKGDWEG